MTVPATAALQRAPTADDELQQSVVRVVRHLQAKLDARAPAGAARAARLRRALSASPGSEPTVWADTVGALPISLLGHSDAPSQAERAVHAAVCLYALHQQSQSVSMHQEGQGLGRAVRRLRRARTDDEETSPVLRRFHALATATSYEETLHHLRGLIALLRSESIPLDYGRLAVDLRRLQRPTAAGGVRLVWGRDLHRPDREPSSLQRPTTTTQDASGAPAANEEAGEDA